MADADNKTCTQCRELKPASGFAKQGKYLKSKCKDCHKSINRAYRESKTPDERRFQSVMYNYGITREQYIDMLLDQDFRCPVCTKPLDFGNLHLDHCHSTGKVRGVLDVKCNTALGKFEDNIATLARAQVYLEVNDA